MNKLLMYLLIAVMSMTMLLAGCKGLFPSGGNPLHSDKDRRSSVDE